jgi:hypothetical protein
MEWAHGSFPLEKYVKFVINACRPFFFGIFILVIMVAYSRQSAIDSTTEGQQSLPAAIIAMIKYIGRAPSAEAVG